MNRVLQKLHASSSLWTLFFIFCIWLVSLGYRYSVEKKPLQLMTWDVYGYYAYLPAVFIYQGIPGFEFVQNHRDNYSISQHPYQIKEISPGKKAPIYTIGLAYLWLPFFLMGHLLALFGPWAVDGLSPPYQWALLTAGLFYAIIGFVFLRRILLRYIREIDVVWTMLCLGLGTNYFNYLVVDTGMPHGYLFSFYVLFLWAIIKGHEEPSIKYLLLLTGIGTVMCLIRPSELVAVILVGLYGVGMPGFWKQKHRLLSGPYLIPGAILLAIVLLAPQVIIWKMTTDQWIFNGYSEHHFDFLQPHLWEGLFSYRKGWLVYTPIMTLALVGLFFIRKKAAAFTWAIPVFVICNLYIVLSWHIWWYASSFGQRALVQSYAVLAIPLGILISLAQTRSRWSRHLIRGLIVAAIGLNLFQNWQYDKGILVKDEMTKAYYWEIFGQTHLDRQQRKLLDVQQFYPGREKAPLVSLANWRPEGESTAVADALCIFGEKEYSPAVDYLLAGDARQVDWFRAEASVKTMGDAFDKYKIARLVCAHIRDGEMIDWKGMRYPLFVEEGEWATIDMDFRISASQKGDIFRVFIWNNSPDTACVRQIEIYKYGRE